MSKTPAEKLKAITNQLEAMKGSEGLDKYKQLKKQKTEMQNTTLT